jgi:hypothetical protein
VLVTLLALLISAIAAAGWYVFHEMNGAGVTPASSGTPTPTTGTPFAFDDIAVSVHEEGRQLELLDVDLDGSMLVAFYTGGRKVVYDISTGESMDVIVEQLPGILLVTPDGEEHLLAAPSPLDGNAVGDAVGSVHDGAIAVAWQVREHGVDGDSNLDFSGPSPTISMSTGTVIGLEPVPAPTFKGRPVTVQWGGLHVADGAVVAFVHGTTDATGENAMGTIDAATGAFTAVDEGTFLAPMRDLCDPAGETFGYLAVNHNNRVVHQFSVAQGQASEVRSLTPPEAIADSVPFNACGNDTAALSRRSGDLLWTEGADTRSISTAADGAGDVFLSPDWVAAQALDREGHHGVAVADRTTGVLHELGSNCQRLVAAGDWIAFGHADGDTCTPVAVPVTEVLQSA